MTWNFRFTDACFLGFQVVLEIMKPELSGSWLLFCGEIIGSIADGKTPGAEALQELTLWTDSSLLLSNAHLSSSATSVPNNIVDDENEGKAAEPQSQSRIL